MKGLYLTTLLLAIYNISIAQPLPSLNSADNTFIGGLIVGGNITSLANSNYPGYHKVGLNTGVTVYTRLKGKIWSSIELLYSQKGEIGVRESSSIYAGPYFEHYKVKLDYAELPLLIHYFPKRWYHFTAGASYSQLLNSNEELFSLYQINLKPDQSFFNRKGFDLIVGGGLHVNKNLFLNIRYQRSLTPIRNAMRVPTDVGFGDQYNTAFVFQLVYMIRHGEHLSNQPIEAE